MRTALNPFWVFALVAVVVLIAIVMSTQRRNERQATVLPNAPGLSSGPSIPAALVVFALVVVVAPVGIAIAALWGPSVGIVGYLVLMAGGLIGLVVSRRSHGDAPTPRRP